MGALVEDTRQQKGKHARKSEHFAEIGETVVRCALPVGDYQRPAKVAVDTKKDILELAADLKRDHARFARECRKAAELGTVLVVLVENRDGVTNLHDLESWVEPDKSFATRNRNGGAKRYTGKPLARACQTMHDRYGVMFGFCTPEEAGARVLAILDGYGD